MQEARRLATIAFADIAGYTAMMQADEHQALRVLDTFNEVLKGEMSLHQGQIVQFFGDGCLLSFDSALEGLHAATSMMSAFIAANIPVRIGMHLGDVVFKNNNAFGDGVNVASRVESMAIPGAVVISKTLRDQVKNKTEFELQSLGSYQFKNVEEKMELFAVANPGFVIPRPEQMRGKLEPPKVHQPSAAEQQEWERYQLMEILDAIEEERCVLIMGNYAFSRPTPGKPGEEIFLPELLQREQEKLGAPATDDEKPDFFTAAQSLISRPGGQRKLLRLADIQWQDLSAQQKERFEKISEIPFDFILSTYPFDLCHQAFAAQGIEHQYADYSYLRENTEPEPFDSTHPLIYNLFGSKRHKESMVISLERLYQFFFGVLGTRPLPRLIQDKVQRATQLVFLGFSFDDWYMKLLLRMLKVHEKDTSYAHPPGPGGLRQGNQTFYESNFRVTFLNRQIDTFVSELHELCQNEGLLRQTTAQAQRSIFPGLREMVHKFRLEDAMDQLDEYLIEQSLPGRFLRELADRHRRYHQIREWELYEQHPEDEIEGHWQELQQQVLDLIDRVEGQAGIGNTA